MAAAPFLRLGRLSEQRLRLESSFGILRGTPSVMDFCTKSGNPNKPVRYTSIKKAKPKTIIDIGKLILQKTNDTKSPKQSVIAEAAMKAATKTAKHPALKQSAVSSDLAATKPKVATAASSSVQVTPVAANTHCDSLGNEALKVSDAGKPLATSSSTAEDLCDTCVISSGEQGNDLVKEGHKKVPAPAATRNLESSSTECSSFAALLEEKTADPESDPDERASPPKATPKSDSSPVPVPIDVTYSEEVNLIDKASTEPSVGVLSAAAGTVTTEMVNSQSVGAVDIPVTPEVYFKKCPLAGHVCSKPTQVPEDAEIINAPKGSAAVPTPTSEETPSEVEVSRTRIQDGGQLTSTVSSSKTFVEDGTVAFVSTPEVKVAPDSAQSEVTPLVPSNNTIVEVERANQQTVTEIHEIQAEEKYAMAKVSMNQDSDPTNEEFADEKLTTEEAGTLRDSEAQLDPIKRLFLDKIREYSTKSKAHDGLVDAGPEYEKEYSEELAKLQRLYGNGDLTAFPEFEFPEPMLDEFNPK